MVCGCVIMVLWMCYNGDKDVLLPRIMLGCIT